MDIFFIGIGLFLILAIIAAIATKLTKKKEGEPDVVNADIWGLFFL